MADEHARQGLSLLAAGWDWPAARRFREVAAADGSRALGQLLLARATRHHPNRAARFVWQAAVRAERAPAAVRVLIDAYQRYYAIEQQPELRDPRFAAAPSAAQHRQLVADLGRLAADGTPWAAELLRVETATPSAVGGELAVGWLRRANAYLQATDSMPFQLAGYRRVLTLLGEDRPHSAQLLARLPRHPHLLDTGPAAALLPGRRDPARIAWQPRKAPAFALPAARPGVPRIASKQYAGKPMLVVFFLGFG